jgi:hypothetical protein
MPRPHLTPGKDPVPILQLAEWASGPVWTGAEDLVPSLPPPGFDPRTVQAVGSRCTDYATRPTPTYVIRYNSWYYFVADTRLVRRE